MSHSKSVESLMTLRVLVVEDDTLVGIWLKSQLEKLGHTVIGQAADPAEAQVLFQDGKPDLVLMDIRLGSEDGLDLAERLLRQRACPMVVVSAFADAELIHRAAAVGVFGYLIKPVSMESLAAQIEVAVRRFQEQQTLRQANQSLEQAIETRKLTERAKGIFMKHLKLSEAEAHRRLQQESQKRRISLTDLAKKIIESEDLLKGL